ncbi:MAG: cadherin-like beta sandwich domain-containing protein, partial [Bacteroidota bacterium]|nr:cadherin-like beta sandwich domain-containing protein [Bacteroidota bacterium]
GTPTASGTVRNVALSVGSNMITTIVTAQDGTTKTYTITITRAPAPSSDANLSNLTISAGTLTPAFASGTTSYTASVANSVTSVDVTPTASNVNATITVNGTPTASGTVRNVALSVGSNMITTIVTAQDGTTKTYTITIIRAPAALAPTAITTAATSITTSGATLNGTINDNGATTTVSFEYGTSPTLSGATSIAATTGATVNAGSGNTAAAVTVSGLLPGTTYYFRVNGTNSAGATNGNILSFTTAAANNTDIYCDLQSRNKKVYVCHKGKTICVSLNALQSHLNHGDNLGKCAAIITSIKTNVQDSNVPETISTTFKSGILNEEAFKVIIAPNPSSADFTIKVESNSDESINIRVFDAVGRLMTNISGVKKNSLVVFGRNYKEGNYFAEVVQGKNRKTIKLVKM